jgi:hypothetical protein
LGPPGAQLRHWHRLESLDLAAFPFFGSACLGGLLFPSLSDATPGTAQGGAGRGKQREFECSKGWQHLHVAPVVGRCSRQTGLTFDRLPQVDMARLPMPDEWRRFRNKGPPSPPPSTTTPRALCARGEGAERERTLHIQSDVGLLGPVVIAGFECRCWMTPGGDGCEGVCVRPEIEK